MSFAKIVGQDIIGRVLKNIIVQEQARGAYLFLGPDGVGKRTTAIEFAKMLNCENNKEDACDSCLSCNKIDSSKHPDVFSVYPEGKSGSIKIQKIREIIYEASLRPYEGLKRVYIINDSESMTEEAQNAFLKTLEEPYEHHIFILTASNIAGLVPTIFSRCKVLRFNSLGRSQVHRFLQRLDIGEREADLLSHMSMGSIGMAVSIKEKNRLSLRDQVLNDFFFRRSALFREDILKEMVDNGIEEGLYMLLCWYRDLLISKFTDEEDLLLNIDRKEAISSFAKRFSREKLERDIFNVMKAIGYVRKNINPKMALFDMALQLNSLRS